MREKLITYLDFLFAGAPRDARTEETKAEILQNTLDKYDDLIDQGKAPEAAYSLAVAGIGDVGELLTRGAREDMAPDSGAALAESRKKREEIEGKRALMRVIAIMLYITCVLPPILMSNSHLEDTLAPALMFVMIAIATGLMVFQYNLGKAYRGREGKAAIQEARREEAYSGKWELKKAIGGAVYAVAAAVYFIVSFATMAWHLTWLIFPVAAALNSLIRAILDLKEE